MSNTAFIKLLSEYQKLGLEDMIGAELYNEILLSYHSTAIEGSSLTQDEVALLITDGITAAGKPLNDHLMVRDHHYAIKFALEQAKAKVPVTSSLLQNMSALVMKSTGSIVNTALGSYDVSRGDFRKSSVCAQGGKIYMDQAKVPTAVERICQGINYQINLLANPEETYELSFDAHLKLAEIHPFADGNGRVARLLMNFIIHRHNLPLVLLFKEDKAEYIKTLIASQDSGDVSFFRNFMFRQQIKHISSEICRFKQAFPEKYPETKQTEIALGFNVKPKKKKQ
jgi:Fic family protein